MEEIYIDDLWNLDYTLSVIILKYLKEFKKHCPVEKITSKDKDFQKILDKMIRAFELVIKSDERLLTREEQLEYEKGMKSFCKYFQSLSW